MSGFRAATTEDEGFFLTWRHLRELHARSQGWWSGTQTGTAEHHRWFRERLGTSKLLVWVDDGIDAGLARIESNGEIQFETSTWREHRLLADLKPFSDHYGRLKMTIDEGDPKWEALERAGWRQYPARFYVYRERP